ncbi:MAG TPA: hypothetical protein VFW21_00460 [Mycobacterium sp.]|nr:hypothetical protein [Mycobacterium sp.]
MTGPEESQSATRPISVAELLAKNGSIGAPPPAGGRRRRRRGNSDAVTVAELTGEIPIVRADTDLDTYVDDSGPELSEEPVARRGRDSALELSEYPRPIRPATAVTPAPAQSNGAESMSPDPVDELTKFGDEVAPQVSVYGFVEQPDELGLADVTLFGGDSMADELTRAGGQQASGEEPFGEYDDDEDAEDALAELGHTDALDSEDFDAAEEFDALQASDTSLATEYDEHDEEVDYPDDFYEEPSRGRRILRGLLTAAQSVLAVLFGAGLFLAFEQLWKWNSLVAMLLAILVTLGLVAGVWVVRKTEDIASTLIAVGVGLLVTFGPLALMHAS